MKVATLKDIKDFLAHLGYNWTGKIYDEKNSKTRTATIADFNGNAPVSLFVETKGGIKEVKFLINEIDFEQHGNEDNMWSGRAENSVEEYYSEEWQNFLLNRHGAVYAKVLYDWNNDKCKNIIANARDKLEQLEREKTRIKEIANARMAPYEARQRELMRKFPETLDEHIV